ncbi:CHAT domain-containing protein [Nitratireductor sp. CAU 1489]|uniref:CHAT domain-containing protein n=1 Tax=Nitratireductor arenosus TaxID=2682096 RepID=A0A844QM81_9HYPH|nr:CHAT domain-containing protein [Nitratireductor arenosus]MVA98981.1 CHAT domain-containing protein [Nitratireductor arenosus]
MRIRFLVSAALFLLAASWPLPAAAQAVTPATMEVVEAASRLIKGGKADVDAALQLLENRLAKLASAAHADRYVLAASAASVARLAGDFERSQALFATAAEAIGQVPGEEDRHAATLEARASDLARLERLDEADALYERAFARREESGATRTGTAVEAASARLLLALAMRSEERIAAGLQRLSASLQNNPEIDKRRELSANIALARAYRHLGLYDGMLAFTEIANYLLMQALTDRKLKTAAGTTPVGLSCEQEEFLRRDLAGLLIAAAEFDAAENALAGPLFVEDCADTVASSQGRYLNSMLARLALAAGAPVIAQARLVDFARDGAEAGSEALDTAIARARLAAANTQLGFLGRAAPYFASEAAKTGFRDLDNQIEHLIAWALHDFLSGRDDNSLARLDAAAELARDQRPRDWFLRARIDFRRIYLLIDAGRFDAAAEIRQAFETHYDRHMTEIAGVQKLAIGTPQAGAVLASLRALADLLLATATSDRADVARLLEVSQTAGPPSLPGLEYFAQRAYLDACVLARGTQACRFEMASSFALPYNVPYRIPTLLASQHLPTLSGDLFRYSPLRDRLYGPLSDRLWQAARAADAEAREQVPDDADAAALAAAMQGAATAFEFAQQLVEGAAEKTATQVAQRLSAGDTRLGALLRRRDQLSEQILRARLSLLKGGGDGDIDADLAELDAVHAQISRDFPDFKARYRSDPVSWHDMRDLLSAREAAVLIHSATDTTDIFVVDKERLHWRRVDLGAAALSKKVRALRAGLDPTGGARSAQPLALNTRTAGFDRAAAHQLYLALFSDLEPVLADKELLVVVNGPLAALPLSVLVTAPPEQNDARTPWLIRRNPISVLPSLAMLRLRSLARPQRSGAGFVGFGDPVFSPDGSARKPALLANLAPLPGTRREVEAIGAIFEPAERAIYLGEAANETAVRRAELTGQNVIAFATHGLVAGELGRDSEPGLAFSKHAAAAAGDDGFLSASEAATLAIDADWLLLSACNTAASDGSPDSQGYSGLARAFLFAGARSILVSHWPVRDDAAPLITVEAIKWRRDNPQASPARALQHAMLAMIEDPARPDHADPAVWAPFVVFSGGR